MEAQAPLITSTVVPGALTTACRAPVTRLKRVDLPTFGLPMRTIVGSTTRRAARSPPADPLGEGAARIRSPARGALRAAHATSSMSMRFAERASTAMRVPAMLMTTPPKAARFATKNSAPGLRPSSWRRRRYAGSTSIETSLPRLFLGHFESSKQGSVP